MPIPDNGSAINVKSLGGSLGLLLISLVLSGVLIGAVQLYASQTEQAQRQAQARLAESRRLLARVNEDEREIREKITRYQALIALGRMTAERRLEWVETLRAIKESRRLLGLEYEISPQRPLDPKQVTTGGYDFLASPMKLEMPLLHENDLLGLLSDLAARSEALVSVRSCRIERLPRDATHQTTAMLRANCDLDWITLQEKP